MSRVRELLRRSGSGGPLPSPDQAAPHFEPPEQIGGVLDTYRIPANGSPDSSTEVFVVEEDGVGKYLVRPPKLSQEEAKALEVLRVNLLDSIPAEASGDPREVVADYVWRTAEGAGLVAVAHESHEKLLYYLMKDFSGFWEVDPLVNDDNLEEISVVRYDRPVRVLHRNFSEYMFMETDIVYPSEDRLQAFVRRLAQLGGTTISLAQPSLEVTLHGSADRRVTATLGDEISRPGSTYAIRKQRESPITLAQLAAPERARWPALGHQPAPDQAPAYDEVHSHKTLSVLMAAYFWLLLERTTNVLVAGESIDHDEPILFKDGGVIKLDKIGTLIDRVFEGDEEGRARVSGIEVICFDPQSFDVDWAPLHHVYRHKYSDSLLRFRLQTGRNVAVTPEHSIFIFRGGEIKCVNASEVKKGDRVVAPKKIRGAEDSPVVVDLVSELSGVEGLCLYNVPISAFSRDRRGATPDSWKDWKSARRLPIRYGDLLSDEERETVTIGYKGSRVRIRPSLEIDEAIARLLGYYVAEGWTVIRPRTQCTSVFSFGDEDVIAIPDAISILSEKFGIAAHTKVKGRSRIITFSHRVLGELLARWASADASTKRVPVVVLNSPSQIRKAFVSGWAAGGYGTVSKELANGITYLLMMEDVVATTTSRWTKPTAAIGGRAIRTRHPLCEARFPSQPELLSGKFRARGGSREPLVPNHELPDPPSVLQAGDFPNFKSLSPSLVAQLDRKLERIAADGAHDRRFSRFYTQNSQPLSLELEQMKKLQKTFAFLEVVGIDQVQPTSGYVYDVSVPGCENFLAGFGGIFCHNTNSGKTTLMNAILALANPKCKVVTAEDVLEISLPDHLHWQRLKTRAHRAGLSPTSGRYEYGLQDLLKLALRFSPTILSLGEMRGEESETVAAAITLGFSTMTTVHAENAERCVQRLTTAPMRFSAGHIRDLTAIVTMRKVALQDGRVVRRVVSVDELKPQGPDGHEILNVFRYDPSTDSFTPTTPAEVLDRSFRLNEIADSFGWSPAAVQRSLSVRAARISTQIAGGELSPQALSKMVREFSVDESRSGAEKGWSGE